MNKIKLDFYSDYPHYNHLFTPTEFEWVTDGSGVANVFNDWRVTQHNNIFHDKKHIAMIVEPRTIQPSVLEYMENNWEEFDLIFTHDEKLLNIAKNSYPITFMLWYVDASNVPKTKNISMVCSDKVMCFEHQERQRIARILGNKVDHFGKYITGRYCNFDEPRAGYRFEVCIDNNWYGYWLSEKLANPIASKVVPIYLGGNHVEDFFDTNGIIQVKDINDIPIIVDKILENPEEEYNKRLDAIETNYRIIQDYKIPEDTWFRKYREVIL